MRKSFFRRIFSREDVLHDLANCINADSIIITNELHLLDTKSSFAAKIQGAYEREKRFTKRAILGWLP